jgi:hypothetical protein
VGRLPVRFDRMPLIRLGKRRRYPFGRSKSASDALAVCYGPAADACNAAANVRCCAGFRTPAMRSQPQARRPASEKGQGTKSQGSGAPSVPRALWGFSYGVRVGKVGSKMLRPSICREGQVWVTDRTSGRGLPKRIGGPTGPVLSTGGKRGLCGPRASRNVERHWGGERWQRHHEVSMLSAVAAEVGRCFGWQPAAKVSMMIMRPPQQQQGRGGTWGSSVAAVLDVWACCERDGTTSN